MAARRTFCVVTLLDLDAPTAVATGLQRLSATVDVDVDQLTTYAEVPFLDLVRRRDHTVLMALRLGNVEWMRGKDPAAYLPDAAEVVHVGARMKQATGDVRFIGAVAAVPEATFLLVQYAAEGDVFVTVAARDIATAQRWAGAVRERVPASTPRESGTVPLHTWHQRRSGEHVRRTRMLEVPAWSEIDGNYPEGVRRSLAGLMDVERPAGHGRLVLWHGPPGTGKTTALRALARAWQGWCDTHYVSDAERMFDDLDYLDSVAFGGEGPRRLRPGGDERWRLVVAEDSDEYLRADARQSAGSALGRLLNLADGLLGQGLRTLVLLTTNEPLHELHPALVRPGRALAKVEFARFSVDEAQRWLGGGSRPEAPMTLAELFERRGDVARIGVEPAREHTAGLYL